MSSVNVKSAKFARLSKRPSIVSVLPLTLSTVAVAVVDPSVDVKTTLSPAWNGPFVTLANSINVLPSPYSPVVPATPSIP